MFCVYVNSLDAAIDRGWANACIYAIWLLSATFPTKYTKFSHTHTHAMQMSNGIVIDVVVVFDNVGNNTTNTKIDGYDCCYDSHTNWPNGSFLSIRYFRLRLLNIFAFIRTTIKLYTTNDAIVKRCTIYWCQGYACVYIYIFQISWEAA